MLTLKNLIAGRLQAPGSGDYLEVFEPATGNAYAKAPRSGTEDVERAVEAAVDAFPAWSALAADKRAAFLERIAALMEAELDELARMESTDTGKPLSLARTVDIPRAVANLRFFAGAVQHFASESHVTDGLAINYTLREPLGAVGCISPWNLPLYLFTWKIAPALAAGNTVVGKPSELTPMTAARLGELCIEAGLPPGVLNIVHGLGEEAGAALVAHAGIKAVSFTGGTDTGRKISAVAAPAFKKLSLEMGGKNPAIVFADAPPERTLEGVLRGAYSNQGEICLCGSRILVERSYYKAFRERLLKGVRGLKVDDPLENGTDIGALISEAHRGKVEGYLALALKEGGDILCGGGRAKMEGRCKDGWFLEPALIEGLGPGCRTNQEEIFGPVATLIPFDGEDEAVAIANSTPYGLAASLWTNDVSRCHRLARELQTGILWVNCWMLRDLRTPFGGAKQSGMGREGGFEALRFFTEAKNVCIAW